MSDKNIEIICDTLLRLGVIGTGLTLWLNGYQNGWVIAIFIIGLL